MSASPVLHPYLGRESWRTTCCEVTGAGRFPIFVKPYAEAKVFTEWVVSSVSNLRRLLQPQQGFPTLAEDFPCWRKSQFTF